MEKNKRKSNGGAGGDMSLIGTYIACTIFVPIVDLAGRYGYEKVIASCKIVDDRYERVGSPGHYRTPIDIDCSEDPTIKLLNPRMRWPRTVMKEDRCDT